MAQLLNGTALVTGAASGIGRGTVFGLAKHGIQKIALGDVNEGALESVASEVKSMYPGTETLCLRMDVTSEESVAKAVAHVAASFGRLDIAVNNAGVIGPLGPAPEIRYEDWTSTINVNMNGVWLCQRAEIAQMLQQERIDTRRGRGVIVNMASMYGTVGILSSRPATAYSASKYAVIGLTKTDANRFAEEGIRINAICPGYVVTPLIQAHVDAGRLDGEIARTPMKRLGQIEEIVDSIIYLASPMSSFMTGASLVVDGGFTAK